MQSQVTLGCMKRGKVATFYFLNALFCLERQVERLENRKSQNSLLSGQLLCLIVMLCYAYMLDCYALPDCSVSFDICESMLAFHTWQKSSQLSAAAFFASVEVVCIFSLVGC